MTETLLTRRDTDVGEGEYDSIAWAFEVHVEQPDRPELQSAILYGDESCPDRIDFFREEQPLATSWVAFTWRNKNAVWLNREEDNDDAY